jgi:hypothetical protein
MYDKILRQMRKAAKAGRMVIRKHTLRAGCNCVCGTIWQIVPLSQAYRGGLSVHAIATRSNEMRIDDLSEDDIINGILTGEIIEDQFDIDYQDTKYIIYGDALDGREIGLVAKLDRYGNVAIITAYWLKLSDYE